MGQQPTKLTREWADHPFPIMESTPHKTGIPSPEGTATNFATRMLLLHNIIIRALNAIYLQAPYVTNPTDIADFTTFMYAWVRLLSAHHASEEAFVFPWMEEAAGEPGFLHRNVEQHEAFAPGLKEFDEYVKGLREGSVEYDGGRVRGIIDGFGGILELHLREEVESLEALEQYKDRIDWEYIVPLILTNGDVNFEKGWHEAYWPPFPWWATILFKWTLVPKHKGAWRFSSADTNANPKDLPFAERKDV